MIRNIQEFFKIAATMVIGSMILFNCEPDADRLGSQFFQDGAQGVETSYPLIAYNFSNGDSVRTDASRLQGATLGAFNDPQFGLQKSSYVTQIRLLGGNPDFGTNAVLDSAVLVIKPQYAQDSVTTVTNEDYVFAVGAVLAKLETKTYPVSKYGNTKLMGKTMFNIKVEEVTEFLGSAFTEVRSTRNVTTGAVLATHPFDGNVKAIKITKDTDNSTLFERVAGIRIPLDSTFIANKIISKASAPELSDAASFIRYFKGIKISVEEDDGYLFNFDPNSIELNLYYKSDKVQGDVTTREQSVYFMNAGSANAHFNQIIFNRAGTPSATALATSNQETGDAKIYAQGMGGPGIGLRVPAADVAAIKSLYNNNKIGIVSAKMRIYTDQTSSLAYKKPESFVVRQRNLTPAPGEKELLDDFLKDMSTLAGTGYYSLVKAYDLEKTPAYYDIGITQTFKDIIEKGEPDYKNYDFVLNVGTYTTDATGSLIGALNISAGGQNFTTRAYTPNRAVFVGTDPGNEKSAELILTYGQKQ